MFVHWRFVGGGPRRLWLVGVAVLSGCGVGGGTSDTDASRQTLSLSSLRFNDEDAVFEGGPNDLIETAELIDLSPGPQTIRGRIDPRADVDVFDLGPAGRGDRIVVDTLMAPALQGAVALFDDTGASLLVNDHRNVYLGQREPFIDVILRRGSGACYLAVSATPGFASTGEYALMASKQSEVPVPRPRPDTILLSFDGGESVRIGSRPAIQVPPFDAASIDARFAGTTEEMLTLVVAAVREDYRGLGVTILSTSEGAVNDGSMSRLFFGTFDSALLGVAEGVDEFNATKSQEAIVFTDTFEAFLRLDPSVEEMATALANVAAHEIGHLLGLVHVADRQGLMDVTASLNDLLLDQWFSRAPIHSGVFPIGMQDAIQYLLDAVGGDVSQTGKQLFGYDAHEKARLAPSGPPARGEWCLSTCGLDELPE